ncbi:hypothetical protein ANANG_G00080150 [Anguilla anguilla]|uniref:BRK domain-containing protein n=1 Tax=Anguilla anguilla TaxID=7936 RepID=A0A9D3S2V7_ANGAN|nr:hypothetical protein ANANG_G00080150 [Anguilla anguilla]
MELLQAGLSGTPTRHMMNGSFLEGDVPMKRRRGRRKNVEGLDLLFMGSKRAALNAEDSEVTKAFADGVRVPPQPQRNIPSPEQLDPSARVPVINLEDGTRLVGEDAPTNKDLMEWLNQHPTYTVDIPSYVPKNEDHLLSPFQKPKQKRHRCRNPNKIDINTLTGEERVPVVNRRNGKKMGGAMAPPMKDLPRWLEENPEFAISPDWTEIVKQSGFLPESMFDRLLTGPVVREEGASRRGRRPKSEIAKAAAQAAAAAAAAAVLGHQPPADEQPVRGHGPGQPAQPAEPAEPAAGRAHGLSPGLAAAGADAKHASAMLPLMLPGMAGLPNMFGLSGLFNNNLAAAAAASVGSSAPPPPPPPGQGSPRKAPPPRRTRRRRTGEDKELEKPGEAGAEANGEASLSSAAAAAAAGMSANPLAFNPFLLSTMAPGLFYPSMFLPPGLSGLALPGFPQATLAGLQSAMAGAGAGAAAAATTRTPAAKSRPRPRPRRRTGRTRRTTATRTRARTRLRSPRCWRTSWDQPRAGLPGRGRGGRRGGGQRRVARPPPPPLLSRSVLNFLTRKWLALLFTCQFNIQTFRFWLLFLFLFFCFFFNFRFFDYSPFRFHFQRQNEMENKKLSNIV